MDLDTPPFLRLFVALDIGEPARHELGRAIRRLAGTDADVAWVRRENLHLSLAFLGNVAADLVPGVREAIRSAAAGTAPFECAVAGLGAFGPPRAPRVVWAGIRAPAALVRLQADVLAALRGTGLSLDARPFAPHVTLGRVRSARGRRALADALAAAAAPAPTPILAEQVVLMRSVLQPRGAVYSPIAFAPLDG